MKIENDKFILDLVNDINNKISKKFKDVEKGNISVALCSIMLTEVAICSIMLTKVAMKLRPEERLDFTQKISKYILDGCKEVEKEKNNEN